MKTLFTIDLKINEGEDKLSALVREVQEEVALTVIPESIREYGVVHRFQKSGKAPDTVFVQDSFYYTCDVEKIADGTELSSLKITKQKLDDYDRLIQLLDSCCGADGTKDLEKRMGDVKARYGYYPQPKWDKNFELKEYFEKLAGKDLYKIIEN